jgi:hypothetical protein
MDVKSADAAGVDLKRLLWVRGGSRGMKALEQAFRCADLLIQASSGFGLVIVDLADIPERLERLDTALLFSTPCAVTATCSALTLTLAASGARWSKPVEGGVSHTRLFAGFDYRVEAARKRSFSMCIRPQFPGPGGFAL